MRLITLHDVMSKKASTRQTLVVLNISRLLYKLQAEMAESELIQTAIRQVAFQAARVVVMALSEADTGPTPGTTTANAGEAHRPRHGRPVLRQSSLDWKSQDKYVELLRFKMEVLNVPQTRT